MRPGVRDMFEEPETEVIIPDITVMMLERNQHSYAVLAEKTKDFLDHPRFIENCKHIVDATGVGVPTMDFMRRSGMKPIGVWITSGSEVGKNQKGGYYTVPKRDLVNALQLAFSSGYIKFAKGLEPKLLEQLKHELRNFKEKKTSLGNTTWEAWREKDHDDLVLALAINVWYIMMVCGIQVVRKNRRLRSDDDYDPLADLYVR